MNVPSKSPVQLFSKETQAIFFNYKPQPIQRMLDFDYVCKRKNPSVAAIVHPQSASGGFQKAFFGRCEIAIPVYDSIEEASSKHPKAAVFINYASFRSAFESSLTALQQPTIQTVVIIAEGVPERNTKVLIARAKQYNKIVIGPATVGGIQAGSFKIGDTAGTIENIYRCKLYRPGSVGFVSKSGGLSNEMYNVLARTTDGIFEGIAIGGDTYPGSTLADHVWRFEQIPNIKMIVVLGELGGRDEYQVAEMVKKGLITKPIVAWVSGTCASCFHASEVQFGHAGAKSGESDTSALSKNAALKSAGVHVPDSFEAFAEHIQLVYERLVKDGVIIPAVEIAPEILPKDLHTALKEGHIRKATHIVSTISDDRGEEPLYLGIPISEVIQQQMGIGDVISLLWFKKKLPRWASKFIEMCLIVAADHGPCVSGAHNTIVTARAGKDLISCLCSGLLTIGPRFGGAIDDAAINFKKALDNSVPPDVFVEDLKRQGRRVEGIGHRIKTAENQDKRVELLCQYAKQHFPAMKYFNYARAVESYTLQKANNLVLNIDGCIGSLLVDLLSSCGCFHEQEVKEILELGALNGLFVLSRSMGLIGHALDQKRMKQPLYRHPTDDVLYATE
ncbi:ATP-citrate synthase beta chain protein 1 [Galdieria sulphuraria]|nr:ATP-citrate synthase beta chain protein 1 [Galdieria sulphuraria]